MTARGLVLDTALLVVVLGSSPARAITLTFDDVPTATPLRAYVPLNVQFGGRFEAADHSASEWGPPRSGHNVLVLGQACWEAMVKFGYDDNGFKSMPIRSLGAYFSTQQGAVVNMVGYFHDDQHPVATVLIGSAGEQWSNRYVEVSSTAGDITYVSFYPVSSADALLYFCADDLTINFVPEPSSLASLSLALLAAGAGVRWRRRG